MPTPFKKKVYIIMSHSYQEEERLYFLSRHQENSAWSFHKIGNLDLYMFLFMGVSVCLEILCETPPN